jgi:hypothetical protein
MGVGGIVVPATEPDCPQPSLAPRLDPARRRIEPDASDQLDAIGEQRLHRSLVYGCGGQDARAGGRPLCLRYREPFGAGERGRRIEAEAAAAGGDPVFASGITTF